MRVLTTVSAALLGVLLSSNRPLVAVAAATAAHPDVKVLQSHALPGISGESMTSLLVTFPPGFRDALHHHVGSVFVYVLSGTMRTAFGSAPAVVLHAGQSFFEPGGMHHRVAQNVSMTQPLQLLVTTIAPPDAPPVIYEMKH